MNSNNSTPQSKIKFLFKNIPDLRIDRTRFHPLESILYIVLCGTMAGIDSWIGYADYAEAHQDELAKVIDLSAGIPSHDTIGRVISLLDVESFAHNFKKFASHLVQQSKGIIAIDGKTMRGSHNQKENLSAKHIVSAWSDCCKTVLGQIKTHEISNEITAIPELLDKLDIEGQTITIDAMGCQRDICKKIIAKGGDYVISLKGNQGNLHSDIKEYFEDSSLPISNEWEEFDKGHGRIEHRICKTLDDLDWLDKNHGWPGLETVAMVNAIVETKGKTINEVRYYISSLPSDAQKVAKADRSHWEIENKLHWVLDVTWNEDKSSIRKDNAPEIVNMMRKWALNIINQQKGSLSVKRMTNKIAMSSKFLRQVIEKI
jgi:predicted transposase YbfD/YdcC